MWNPLLMTPQPASIFFWPAIKPWPSLSACLFSIIERAWQRLWKMSADLSAWIFLQIYTAHILIQKSLLPSVLRAVEIGAFYTYQLFLTQKRAIFFLGVPGFSMTTRRYPKISENFRTPPKKSEDVLKFSRKRLCSIRTFQIHRFRGNDWPFRFSHWKDFQLRL